MVCRLDAEGSTASKSSTVSMENRLQASLELQGVFLLFFFFFCFSFSYEHLNIVFGWIESKICCSCDDYLSPFFFIFLLRTV
jgi:hypothetical protein